MGQLGRPVAIRSCVRILSYASVFIVCVVYPTQRRVRYVICEHPTRRRYEIRTPSGAVVAGPKRVHLAPTRRGEKKLIARPSASPPRAKRENDAQKPPNQIHLGGLHLSASHPPPHRQRVTPPPSSPNTPNS